MMTQLIAMLALIVISIGLTFGNYWFTFGLWPKSWLSFIAFGLASMILGAAMSAVMKSKP